MTTPTPDADRQQAVLEAVDELRGTPRRAPGDVLVFLAGEREIRETAEALRKHHPPHTEILPLYARLSAAEQDRVFQLHPQRRIILATNVAETSLTVPGIRYVVDSGLARMSRYSARRRVQLLPIEPIAQASAEQRAGRCGRVAEGLCIRLFSEADCLDRDRFTDPEILRTNLASVILQMHAMSLGQVEQFPFIDPPRAAMIREGRQTLIELGALDEHGRLTDRGTALARLPVDPRLGRMILEADREDCLREVVVIAAALSVPDPRRRPMELAEAADAAHEQFRDEGSDFTMLLNIWAFFHEQKKHLSWNKLRRCCQENYLSFMRMREWMDVHHQLKRLVGESGMRFNAEPAAPEAIHRSLLSGLLSSIALKDRGTAYTGAGGKVIHLFPGSGVHRRAPQWIMAAELVETSRLYARTVARFDPAWVEPLAEHLIKKRHDNARFCAESGKVIADERVTLYGLPVVTGRSVHYGPIDPAQARELFIQQALVEGQCTTAAPFLAHNSQLLESIETLQAKQRRADLLVDDAVRYAFYDQRLPAEVFSQQRLERWCSEQPDALLMSRADLMRQQGDIGAEQFPDTLAIGGQSFPLTYLLEPGHEADGVTLTVPVEMVHQLDQEQLGWLVPGYGKELLTALIKTLPKTLRRNYVPAPDFAVACLDRIDYGAGSPTDALATALATMTGRPVPADAWQMEKLPPHLKMNVELIGPDGSVVAAGRDLAELRRATAGAAAEALEATDVVDEAARRSGITTWDFDDLPESVNVSGPGGALTAWPALADDGDSVRLCLRQSAALAELDHRRGLRRLFLLQVAEEMRYHLDALPDMQQLAMHFAPLGPRERINDELALLIADRTFLDGGPLPRTRADFFARLDGGFGRIWEVALEQGALAASILARYHQLVLAMDRTIPPQWDAAVTDLRRQVGALMSDRFLTETPPAWLPRLPCYLEAAAVRFGKLAGGGHSRDQRQLSDLRPRLEAYRQRRQALEAQGVVDPALQEHRWMLEEMRVSLFAQSLGTVVPTSFKRLDRHFQTIHGG